MKERKGNGHAEKREEQNGTWIIDKMVFLNVLASTTMWFSRCKSARSIKCFRGSRSKSVHSGTLDESIRANRSDSRIAIKPSVAEATCHCIRTIDRSATSEYGHWRNATHKYRTELYVILHRSFFSSPFLKWIMNLKSVFFFFFHFLFIFFRVADFPFIAYYLINTQQTDPANFYTGIRGSSLSKFEPKKLR